MCLKFKVLLVFLFVAAAAFAQGRQQDLATYFSALSRHHRFNGNVLVAENGKIVYEQAFGFADFASERPNTLASTFPIASITKTVTSTAVLQLQEQGKLQVGDPVKKYLPDFPYPTITIRHLLSHTSGLPPYDDLFESLRKAHPATVFTNKDVLPRYAALHLPLLYSPGEQGNYDNINYIFLAILIEKVAGISFQEYLQKHVFAPAGMTQTILPDFAIYYYTAQEKTHSSTLYYYPHLYSASLVKADTVGFISTYWHSYKFKGFGEILTTERDLLKFDQALAHGRLLQQATMQIAYKPVLLANGKDNPNRAGLGWMMEEQNPLGEIVKHSGGLIGLRSILLRNLTKHQTVILIDNTQNEVNGYAEAALRILDGQSINPLGESGARIFGSTLVSKGSSEAKSILSTMRHDPATYLLDENEFNALGYDFLGVHKSVEALETFKVNTELFPTSWNVYDSYGEALAQQKQKEEAIQMYQKSIALNPDNTGGRKALEQLLKGAAQ